MNLEASVRTRGLAGPSLVVRAATGFGFSNPPQASRVNLGWGWWDADSAQDRVAYVREEYQKMYGVAPSQAIIQAAANTTIVYKDTLYKKFFVGMPPAGVSSGPSTPPVEASQAGSTGPLDNRNTVITPNAFPTGSQPVPGAGPVTPGDVRLRDAAVRLPSGAQVQPDGTVRGADGRVYVLQNGAWVEKKGPFGLPATIAGYPTTTVLGAGAVVLIAVALALAYAPKRRR